jgi:hypothetical protein
VLPKAELERYCELIAAIKMRTSNRKGRHLSTAESIRLLEDYGLATPEGFVQVAKGILTKPTANRYLKRWGYDHVRLTREPPAVRFQARYSNDLWQFDLSPSDLKHVKAPRWVNDSKGEPTLMLYSVVDDRSGVAYQEYHCTYGEDVEAALRFLFNAMAPKGDECSLFQGRPVCLLADPGPVARSHAFPQVMRYLGIEVHLHPPSGKYGRRTAARVKGKVERPFRTVKELHETLYHFHEPENEIEANAWLLNFLLRYNDKPRVNLGTLMLALFSDLSTEKDAKLPTQPERRERVLVELVRKRDKPIVLFIDDAHDLHNQTLLGLKRLIELIRRCGGRLSVVLAGHPKLKNDLRRPALEEIGSRASVFELEGIKGHQRRYLAWLLEQCTRPKVKPNELLTEQALERLAECLITPLQIEHYLILALEQAYRFGEKPVTPEIVEVVMAPDMEALEPTLARQGYNAKALAELLNVRHAEIRAFLHSQLPPGRAEELKQQLLGSGIPL